MKRILGNSKGFTLLEILIVIVILAVLAGLAIPVYTAAVEKSKAQEAIQQLELVRASMLRFFQTNGTYAGATLRAWPAGAAAVTDIDTDPNNLTGGQLWRFNYVITAQAAATFTITSTRVAARNAAAAIAAGAPGYDPIPAAGAGTITINELGVVTRSAIYQ